MTILPPHVHRFVRTLGPAVAREFARVTGAVLGPRAFEASLARPGRLNADGSPLEFAFGPRPDELRYAMEVDAWRTAPEDRLQRLDRLLDGLGGAPTGGAAACFPSLQSGHRLHWGAWLSARQPLGSHPSAAATRFKVYAEVPPEVGIDASPWGTYLAPLALPQGPPARWVMVGAAPGEARCEFYFELHSRGLLPEALQGLLERIGLGARFETLLALVQAFEFRQSRRCSVLPQAQYGFSVSLLPQARDPVFALFVFAEDLVGGDVGVRSQVLKAAGRQGLDLRAYAALTQALGKARSASGEVRVQVQVEMCDRPIHNMLSFFVGGGDVAGWQVSLSPPTPLRRRA